MRFQRLRMSGCHGDAWCAMRRRVDASARHGVNSSPLQSTPLFHCRSASLRSVSLRERGGEASFVRRRSHLFAARDDVMLWSYLPARLAHAHASFPSSSPGTPSCLSSLAAVAAAAAAAMAWSVRKRNFGQLQTFITTYSPLLSHLLSYLRKADCLNQRIWTSLMTVFSALWSFIIWWTDSRTNGEICERICLLSQSAFGIRN